MAGDAEAAGSSCAAAVHQQQLPTVRNDMLQVLPQLRPRNPQSPSERLRCLEKCLNKVIPAFRKVDVKRTSTSKDIQGLLSRYLGQAPGYDVANQDPCEYLQQLLEWSVGGTALGSCFVSGSGNKRGRVFVDFSALHAAGCFPHTWELPLSEDKVRAANQRGAKDARENPTAVAQQALQKHSRFNVVTLMHRSASTGAVASGSPTEGTGATQPVARPDSSTAPSAAAAPASKEQQDVQPQEQQQQQRLDGRPREQQQQGEQQKGKAAASRRRQAKGAPPAAAAPSNAQLAANAAAPLGRSGSVPASEASALASMWSKDCEGWWRCKLISRACSARTSELKLTVAVVEALAGRLPSDRDVLQAEAEPGGQQYSLPYRHFPPSRHSIQGGAFRQWVNDMGAQAGDEIALRRAGGGKEARLLVRHIPAAEDGTAATPPAKAGRRTAFEGQAAAEAAVETREGGEAAAEPASVAAVSPYKGAHASGQDAQQAQQQQEQLQGEQEQQQKTQQKGSAKLAPRPSGAALVGRRVEVYWGSDKKWYAGTITAYTIKKHTITYDNGDEKHLVLRSYQWRLETPVEAEGFQQPVQQQPQQPALQQPQQRQRQQQEDDEEEEQERRGGRRRTASAGGRKRGRAAAAGGNSKLPGEGQQQVAGGQLPGGGVPLRDESGQQGGQAGEEEAPQQGQPPRKRQRQTQRAAASKQAQAAGAEPAGAQGVAVGVAAEARAASSQAVQAQQHHEQQQLRGETAAAQQQGQVPGTSLPQQPVPPPQQQQKLAKPSREVQRLLEGGMDLALHGTRPSRRAAAAADAANKAVLRDSPAPATEGAAVQAALAATAPAAKAAEQQPQPQSEREEHKQQPKKEQGQQRRKQQRQPRARAPQVQQRHEQQQLPSEAEPGELEPDWQQQQPATQPKRSLVSSVAQSGVQWLAGGSRQSHREAAADAAVAAEVTGSLNAAVPADGDLLAAPAAAEAVQQGPQQQQQQQDHEQQEVQEDHEGQQQKEGQERQQGQGQQQNEGLARQQGQGQQQKEGREQQQGQGRQRRQTAPQPQQQQQQAQQQRQAKRPKTEVLLADGGEVDLQRGRPSRRAAVAAGAATKAALQDSPAPAAAVEAEVEPAPAEAPVMEPAAAPKPSARQRVKRPRTAAAPAVPAAVPPQPAHASALAAAATGAPLPPPPARCYWLDREGPHAEVLPRVTREHAREKYERPGYELKTCHDCQNLCYKLPCQWVECDKTYCPNCIQLYRYILDFGPGHPKYHLRLDFCRGVCPHCLHVCVRATCRRLSLKQLGAPPPEPRFSTSQQVMFAYNLAHKLLPAVEHIMALQQQEAEAVGKDLLAVPQAPIGYLANGRRAPHSERALCNRCGTCLENLYFQCPRPDCEEDLCPACVSEERRQHTGSQAAARWQVKCKSCSELMRPKRLLPDDQLKRLLAARQELNTALGRHTNSASGSLAVSGGLQPPTADGLRGMMLRHLCESAAGGGTGFEVGSQPQWGVVQEDWMQQLAAMVEGSVAVPPPSLWLPAVPAIQPALTGQLPQQQQQQQAAQLWPHQEGIQQQQQVQQQQVQVQVQQPEPLVRQAAAPFQGLPPAQQLVMPPVPQPAGFHAWNGGLAGAANGLHAANGVVANGVYSSSLQRRPHCPTPAELQQQQQQQQELLLQQRHWFGQRQQHSHYQQQQHALAQLCYAAPQHHQQQQQPEVLAGSSFAPDAHMWANQDAWVGAGSAPASLVQPQAQQQAQNGGLALHQNGDLQAVLAALLGTALPQMQQQQAERSLQQVQQQHMVAAPHVGGATVVAAAAAHGQDAADGEKGSRPKRAPKLSYKAQQSLECVVEDAHPTHQNGSRTARGQLPKVAAGPEVQPEQPAAAAAAGAGAAEVRAAGHWNSPERELVPEVLTPDGEVKRQWWWQHEKLPASDVRRASCRGTQDFIWTPHVSEFEPIHPNYPRAVRLFQVLWGRGEPIIVRGLSGRMGWTPEGMGRVCKESSSKKLQVINCANFSPESYRDMTSKEFFDRYKACSGASEDGSGEPLPMLKLKDFPPSSDFRQVMARHHDDFLEMLNSCMPAYCHPTHAPLNLATLLPWYTKLPDLGPKAYIAFGREVEHEGEGDSVTKLHEDLSDAINIMMHTQHPRGWQGGQVRCGLTPHDPRDIGYGGAGAVWDLVRRSDRPRLRQFLEDALDDSVPGCPPFVHKGSKLRKGDVHDVIHDQSFMLTERHRELLHRAPYHVHTWHFEQYEWEAVFIPSGCPHQVRNLRSSIKVALDFVSPEAVAECFHLRDEFRRAAMAEQDQWRVENPGQSLGDIGGLHFADRLQINNMVLHGMLSALSVLRGAAEGAAELPLLPPPMEEPWEGGEEVEREEGGMLQREGEGDAAAAQQQRPSGQRRSRAQAGGGGAEAERQQRAKKKKQHEQQDEELEQEAVQAVGRKRARWWGAPT